MKLGYVVIGLLLILAGVYVGMGATPLTVTGNTVKITVKSEQGTPIGDATVQMGEYLKHTAPDGTVQFTNVPATDTWYSVRASKIYYKVYLGKLFVKSTSTSLWTQTIYLEPTDSGGTGAGQTGGSSDGGGGNGGSADEGKYEAFLNGYISYSAGDQAAAGGAWVTFGTRTVTSLPNGYYSFNIELSGPAGSAGGEITSNAYARIGDYYSGSKQITIVAGQSCRVDFVINNAATNFAVRVLEDTEVKAPVKGAIVTVGVSTYTTDSAGKCALNGYAAGVYESFSVTASGYKTHLGSLTVEEGQTFDVLLTRLGGDDVEDGWIEGTVKDSETGVAVAGAVVMADGGEIFTVLTDASGYYKVFVPEWNYKITITATGYESYTTGENVYVYSGAGEVRDYTMKCLVKVPPDPPEETDANNVTGIFIPGALVAIGLIFLIVGYRRR